MIIDFMKNSWGEIIFTIIIVFIGGIGIRACLIEKIRKLRRCNVKVKGTIISIKKDWVYIGKRRKRIDKPTCTYSYNGHSYENEIDDYVGVISEKVGDEYEFRINPKKPYETSKFRMFDGFVIFCHTFCFASFFLVAFIFMNSIWEDYLEQIRIVSKASEQIELNDENNNEPINFNENKIKYSFYGVNFYLSEDYVVNENSTDVFIAEKCDNTSVFSMSTKKDVGDKDIILQQMSNYIKKKYPNTNTGCKTMNNGKDYIIFHERIKKNLCVKYAISADGKNRVFIKYVYRDFPFDELDNILRSLTY